MGEEISTVGHAEEALGLASVSTTGLTSPEYRELEIKRLRALESMVLETLLTKVDKIPPGILPTTLGILRDKIDSLEGHSATASARIGQQINIQINGSSDRDALIRQLVGPVSRGTGTPGDTQHVLADRQTPDNQSVGSPGNQANATPFAPPGKRRRGRPKGSRNKPKVVDAQIVDDQRPTPGGGGHARPLL